MDKGYEKEPFESLSIKTSVVQKFRKYSRSLGRSQSITLLLMLEFFEHNQVSPIQIMGPSMVTLENSIKKRINAMIAILRDIEKQQTLPTKHMLDAIFNELPAKPEKQALPTFDQAIKNSDQRIIQTPRTASQTDHKNIRRILGKLTKITPALGKAYYKVNLDNDEIIQLKHKYHVFND